jgi:hypothetical protein
LILWQLRIPIVIQNPLKLTPEQFRASMEADFFEQ